MRKVVKGDTSLAASLKGDLPEYVTLAEIEAACDPWLGRVPTRVAALIGFLWATGARISEALAVRPCDLDVDRGMVRLPTLKRRRKDGSGRKVSACRVVPVSGDHLARVLGLIVREGIPANDRVWPIGRRHAWREISAALIAAGVEKGRAKPHALRHGHAVNAVLQGVPLNLIQQALGHASIVTTAIYLRVTGQDLKAAYSKINW